MNNKDLAPYSLIDLFCGCGGMTSGFIQTGMFRSVWANDFNSDAIRSYRANFDPNGEHTTPGDIIQVLEAQRDSLPKADVVIGGPPCQGFSLLNKQRQGDKRRTLWYQFLQVAQQADARVIVMENVQQLLTSPEFEQVRETLVEMGFNSIVANVVNTANYGVAQQRRRAIIMASRDGWISMPARTHHDLGGRDEQRLFTELEPWRDVRSAIGDLPAPEGTEIREVPAPLDLHFGRNPTAISRERYRAVPPGGNRFDLLTNRPDLTPDCWKRKKSGGTDLFGRLWWDRPSVTIRTEFFKPEKGRYLHPEAHRPITHREASRIQSFPDDFIFCGSKIEIARQIGNAVPPLLARAIAESVVHALDGSTTELTMMECEAMYRTEPTYA